MLTLRIGVLGLLAAGVMGLAAPAAAAPRPGSTPEYEQASKALFTATWTPVFQVDAATAEKNRRTSAAAWPTVIRLMPAACAKDDARACERIAINQSLYARLPSPRAARLQAAQRATELYAGFCAAETQQSYTGDCRTFDKFIKDLENADRYDAATATGYAPTARRRYAMMHETRCAGQTAPSFSLGSACEIARSALAATPADLRRLDEHLCRQRQAQVSCHALGRATAEEAAKLRAASDACNAGKAASCNSAAATLAYAEWRTGWVADTRSFARKSCQLGDATGCKMALEAAMGSRFGTRDLPLALLATDAVCKMTTDKDSAKYCGFAAQLRTPAAKPK